MDDITRLGGHGILRPEDIPDLNSQKGKVFQLMSDGEWHYGPHIVQIAGGSEGLRRMRDLRKIPGVEIIPKRDETYRVWWYRMVIDTSDVTWDKDFAYYK